MPGLSAGTREVDFGRSTSGSVSGPRVRDRNPAVRELDVAGVVVRVSEVVVVAGSAEGDLPQSAEAPYRGTSIHGVSLKGC